MRNIILISLLCEIALVGGAILAGAPVIPLMRASGRRALNVLTVFALALTSWVVAGVTISTAMTALPSGGQFAGVVRLGQVDFKLAIFVPMLMVTFVITYALAHALVAAVKGRSIGDCIRAAVPREIFGRVRPVPATAP